MFCPSLKGPIYLRCKELCDTRARHGTCNVPVFSKIIRDREPSENIPWFCCTALSDNIRTICILMFNKNGHFISGQSGKRKWGVLVHVVFFGLDELCATHAQHDTMYRYLLFLR